MIECKCDVNMWKQFIDIVATKSTEPEEELLKKAEGLAKMIKAVGKNEVAEKKWRISLDLRTSQF